MKKTLLIASLIAFFDIQISISSAQVDTMYNRNQEEITNPIMPVADSGEASPIPTYGYSLRARSYGDSIVLRWAVDNSGAWLTANRYGWRVMRSGGNSDDTSKRGFVEISGHDTPVKPMTLKEMTQRFPKSNLMAGLAAQALYGRNFNPEKLNVTAAKDGEGMQSAVFRQYQEQTQRQIFAYMAAETDGQIASALGMRFVDRDVKRGEYYTYYLEPVYESKLYVVGLSTVSLECDNFVRGESELMPEVDIVQINERECLLRWQKNDLSGYYIERSLDGGKSWTDLSRGVPTWGVSPSEEIRAVYGDSIAAWMNDYVLFFDTLNQGDKAQYRVRAFDAFGELTPWQSSMEFELQDVTPPVAPLFTYIAPVDNKYCEIEWEMPEQTPDLKGFFLSFSEELTGPWNIITPPLRPTQLRYVDSLAGQRGRGYYRIFATDSAGNTSYSAAAINHIEDVTPPAKPTGLKAVADTNGYVYISWNQSPEKDLMGYRLLFANDKSHNFIPVVSVWSKETFYIDTVDIRSLTKRGYYTLFATDNSENVSEYSDTVTVEFPDIVPPTQCIVDHIQQHQDSVEIWWIPSASSDVARYMVYRKPRGSVRWESIATINPSDNGALLYFVDRPAPSDRPYSYSIEAIDSAYLSSGRSGEVVAVISGGNIISMRLSLNARQLKKNNSVKLEWEYDHKVRKEPRGVIYRRIGEADWEAITDISDVQDNYVDRDLPVGASVSYYFILELGNGKYSTPSNIVTVKVK